MQKPGKPLEEEKKSSQDKSEPPSKGNNETRKKTLEDRIDEINIAKDKRRAERDKPTGENS